MKDLKQFIKTTIREFLNEKYESEQNDRMELLRTIMDDKPKLYRTLTHWKSNPNLMYKDYDEAREKEMMAFTQAQSMGDIRVYSSTKIENIKQFGTKSRDEEQSVSTEKSKSLFGDNDVDAVISGVGSLMAYYPKDVSTNELGTSSRKLPITPLNQTQSAWDEGVVKNSDVKWDILFYNPKKFKKEDVEALAKKNNLKPISIFDNIGSDSEGKVPQVIKNSKWLY